MRFTVPVTGTYDINGFFELLDTDPTGVTGIIAANGSVITTFPLTGPGATHPDTTGELEAFSAMDVFLPAGTIIDYGVNNDGNFLNDSTRLALIITSVPGACRNLRPGR